ncbi:MAG: hypothetical protein V1494_04170 [Candidatus Diapherotrites archaeon]
MPPRKVPKQSVNKIVTVVLPDWSPGILGIEAIRQGYSRIASPRQKRGFVKAVMEAKGDPRTMVVGIFDGAPNVESYKKHAPYMYELYSAIKKLGRRGVIVKQEDVYDPWHPSKGLSKKLAGIVRKRNISVSKVSQIVSFGHHKGDCVPTYATYVKRVLKIPKAKIVEDARRSVGSKITLITEIISKEAPGIFKKIMADPELNGGRNNNFLINFLTETSSPLHLRKLLRKHPVEGVDEFIRLISYRRGWSKND